MRAALAEVLRDESRALFERYEPRMLNWLDNRVVRHRQVKPPDQRRWRSQGPLLAAPRRCV